MSRKINNALISVYDKEGLDEILSVLNQLNVSFISTGGTQEHIQKLGYECESVENVTSYPPILGGRVKTLHPKIFGGILFRRDNEADKKIIKSYDIPSIDLVIAFEAAIWYDAILKSMFSLLIYLIWLNFI